MCLGRNELAYASYLSTRATYLLIYASYFESENELMEKLDIAVIQEVCDSLSEAGDVVTRELLSRVADKWSLWVMGVLVQAGGPLRFSRVLEGVGEISQKSLTKTLRQLERDGLATRNMFMEVPPRVEYCLTPLGLELLKQVVPLWLCVAEHAGVFQAARASFDGHMERESSPI